MDAARGREELSRIWVHHRRGWWDGFNMGLIVGAAVVVLGQYFFR